MNCLRVDIIHYTQSDFPGYARCKCIDAFGKTHYFEEKTPIVSVETINENTALPQNGFIRGEIIHKENGMLCFSTLKPDAIESTDGETLFYVYEKQILTE